MMRRVRPVWPRPPGIRAFSTTRIGGVSDKPYDDFNLGDNGGDEPANVSENRLRLSHALPGELVWLRQVHGKVVVTREALDPSQEELTEADALVCRTPGLPCTILTADCLPVFFTSVSGDCVAAAHAGWRGLVAGILEETVGAMKTDPDHILAWLGPGISQEAYAVDEKFREQVLAAYPDAGRIFREQDGALHADLYGLARHALGLAGVTAVYGGSYCTYTDQDRFYSYRRDGQTGRMASVIWIEELPPPPEEEKENDG